MTATAGPTLIPSEKTPPRHGIDGKKLLLYGFPKVGKSTLAAQLSDRALFLATDPGQDALEVFRVPIDSWQAFLNVGRELANRPDDAPAFEWIVVDTIDTLARYCRDHVIEGLRTSGKMAQNAYLHPSDWDYGKAWDAISEEFRLRIARLCSLGIGVVFVSHAKEAVKKTRTGLEITTVAPDVGQKGMRQWLLGFVDFVLYAQVIETKEGNRHVLQLKPSETAEAGGRVPEDNRDAMPAQIALSAAELKATLGAAFS